MQIPKHSSLILFRKIENDKQKSHVIEFFRHFIIYFRSILIGAQEIVKISDFGTSREWNEKSTKMSFAGTVSW